MLPWGDALRPGWFARLHEVSGTPRATDGIRQWVANGQFQIYQAPTTSEFILSYVDQLVACDAFAAETVRFARAAAESTFTVTECARLPSSRAWQVIQWYYAAYYAAHAMLRMFGRSLTYLERGHVRAVNATAGAYGFGSVTTAGFYKIDATGTSYGSALRFRQLTNSKGSHDELWRHFTNFVEERSKEVLANALIAAQDAQDISRDLADLAHLLRAAPHTDGTWMAGLRNEVTYRHTRGAWHPWRPSHGLPSLHEPRAERLRDVSAAIAGAVHANGDLHRFRHLCHAVVALCRVSCEEMSSRCPRGRSFQASGLSALDRLVAQR